MRQRLHHRVYVVRLENPRGDGREGYYVGMTGLPLETRFANHKRGYKSARIVRDHGVGLAWELFEGIPAMTYQEAALAEPTLADDLRNLGLLVYGPTNRTPAAAPRKGNRRSRDARQQAKSRTAVQSGSERSGGADAAGRPTRSKAYRAPRANERPTSR